MHPAVKFVIFVWAMKLDPADAEYQYRITDNRLQEVMVDGKPPNHLEITGQNISNIDESAFKNCLALEKLNLSSNQLSELTNKVFERLRNLQHLDLSHNRLWKLYFCTSLTRLKTLNISYNPVTRIIAGELFGLSKSVKILTEGLKFDCIDPAMFRNKLTLPNVTTSITRVIPTDIGSDIRESFMLSSEVPAVITGGADNHFDEVCIIRGRLKSIITQEKKNNKINDNCKNVERYSDYLILQGMKISNFHKKWFNSKNWRGTIATLNLRNNRIAKVTQHLLNDLPSSLSEINLRDNLIDELKAEAMNNRNPLNVIDFGNNRINNIEVNAFKNLNFAYLILDGNVLEDTKFLDSLPSNVNAVNLTNNKIKEITAGDFAKFKYFEYLYINNNTLKEIKANTFRHFSSLLELHITNNGLQRIQQGCFEDLTNLRKLNLERNSIKLLKFGVFKGLKQIKIIDMRHNELFNIESNVFSDVSGTLRLLDLSNNNLRVLNHETFVNVPKDYLTLSNNRIYQISEGAFKQMSLKMLYMHGNELKTIDPAAFKELTELRHLGLSNNKIHKLTKNGFQYQNNLISLDLDKNTFKELFDGSLFSFSMTERTDKCPIRLTGINISSISGGAFTYTQ